jgi:hypothetical protein
VSLVCIKIYKKNILKYFFKTKSNRNNSWQVLHFSHTPVCFLQQQCCRTQSSIAKLADNISTHTSAGGGARVNQNFH